MKVSYGSWCKACGMVRREKPRLRSYLQWYPFFAMNVDRWDRIESEQFYSTFIEDGSFILCKSMRFLQDGLVQKKGHAFRDTMLVSPVMYLYLLAFAVEYYAVFSSPCAADNTFYSGDVARERLHYRGSYRSYCQALELSSREYRWCVKTDISHFFGSINVDRLISDMERMSNEALSLSDAQFVRGLLLYCGKGGFPTIQNHAGLSFLATVVYLCEVDEALSRKLRVLLGDGGFRLVRYVDDLYVFYNSDDELAFSIGNDIAGIYADALRRKGLAINPSKTRFLAAAEAAKTTAEVSFVDYLGICREDDLPADSQRLAELFSRIARSVSEKAYSEDVLDGLIEELFSIEGVSLDSKAAFHRYLFDAPELFREQSVVDAIGKTAACGKIAYSFMTEGIVLAILNTRDESLIKLMLNSLFTSSRHGSWTSIDSLVAITYLRFRGMVHEDLLEHLKRNEPGLHEFIDSLCLRHCAGEQASSEIERELVSVLADEDESKIQYVLYLYHRSVGNIFEAASYYRAFFDRFSTYVSGRKNKRARSGMLYKEKDLKPLYSDIAGSREVIRNAERLRQENPLVHAGAEMLRRDSTREELEEMISSLRQLMIARLEKNLEASQGLGGVN